jgi:signal transduction histidine kinase
VSDVQRVRGPVQESLRLCRALAHDAAPNLRGDIGDSLEALATMTTAAGVRCQLSVDPATASLAGEQALELYRIAQEAVTNALKHGKCQEINVRLAQRGPAIELTISDNGIGFRDDGTPPVAGLGFRTMRYRAARAGGSVVFRANADRGVTVHVRVPRLAA